MSSSEEVFACSGSVSFSSSEREEVVARSHGYESSISSDPDPNDLGASDQPHDPRSVVDELVFGAEADASGALIAEAEAGDLSSDNEEHLFAVEVEGTDEPTLVEELHTILVNVGTDAVDMAEFTDNNLARMRELAGKFREQHDFEEHLLLLQVFFALGDRDTDIFYALSEEGVIGATLTDVWMDDYPEVVFGALLLLSQIFLNCRFLPPKEIEKLDLKFCKRLLSIIDTQRVNVDETILQRAMLAFVGANYHFKPPHKNYTLQAISSGGEVVGFAQELVKLFNRGEGIFDEAHYSAPAPCLKMLSDIFGNWLTANIFYENDAKVLVDVFLREIEDRGEGDPLANAYLSALKAYLLNSPYSETLYRLDDLRRLIDAIYTNDSATNHKRVEIAEQILDQCPFLTM